MNLIKQFTEMLYMYQSHFGYRSIFHKIACIKSSIIYDFWRKAIIHVYIYITSIMIYDLVYHCLPFHIQDFIMQLSHLSRFDHDWYRGLHRGPMGTIISNLIRMHHRNNQANIGKKFVCQKFCHDFGTIVTIASDRMTS